MSPTGLSVCLCVTGVISWARGSCASARHPTVFTRICSYVDWIHEVMIGNQHDYDY